MFQNLNFLGFSKAAGIYLKAYEPYMEKRERAVMSLPVIIQNQEYRLLYSKMMYEPLYTKMIVLYNNGEVVFDADETHRCLYASHGLTLYKEPKSQFNYDVRQGESKRRSLEIESLWELINKGSGLFDQTEQEVIKRHLEYYIGLKEIGKPLSKVGQQLLDLKRQLEQSEKVTEAQVVRAIELYDERTKQRDVVERLLFSNGEYTRIDANKLFRKRRREIIKLIGRKTYRSIMKEMRGAEHATPRIIRETNQVYERNMKTKKDFLTFLDEKPTVIEMFVDQSAKVMDFAWILSSSYTK